jgi:Domain of unknown function (DUF4157)
MNLSIASTFKPTPRLQKAPSRPATAGSPAGLPLFLAAQRQAPEQIAASGRSTPVETLATKQDAAPIRIFDSPASHRAAAHLGAYAYTWQGDVFLGTGLGRSGAPSRSEVLRHEMIHAHQARNRGSYAHESALEAEAHRGSTETPTLAANPSSVLGWWWVVPLIAGAYVLLRPNVANAPAPGDRTTQSVSELQVAGEALALFAVPTGVAGVLGRLGYGVVASFAISGAASSVAFRGVQDAGAGEFSGVEAYVVDATTGLVIGAVVGGVFRPFVNLSRAASPNPPLMHLTDAAGEAGITASQTLRGSQGIYALPSSTASEGTAMRVLRTLLRPGQTSQAVQLPPSAGGLFSRPLPMGPLSAYQRMMGVYRAPAGSINMLTGEFTASGNALANITGQFFPYGVDAMLWLSAGFMGSMASPSREGAADRGMFSPLYSLVRDQQPLPFTERSDGPFMIMPPASDAGVLGDGGLATDPISQLYTPNSQSSIAPGASPLPAIILVVPTLPEVLDSLGTGSPLATP